MKRFWITWTRVWRHKFKLSKSLEEQKISVVDAVLDLEQKTNALVYLVGKLDEKDIPEVKLALEVFDDLLEFIYLLLWESIVINLYWLYDRKGQRGLIWYLKQIKNSELSGKKVDEHLKRIESLNNEIDLNNEIEKVKKIRNKWIAHRDKEPYVKYGEFWKKETIPSIQEIKTLTETAFEIVQEPGDATNSGINIPFLLGKVFIEEDFVSKLKKWGLSNHLNSSVED